MCLDRLWRILSNSLFLGVQLEMQASARDIFVQQALFSVLWRGLARGVWDWPRQQLN